MTTETSVALNLLQLVALATPPIAVLIQMLRRSENLPWATRKYAFGLAIMSIASFLGTGGAVSVYFLSTFDLPMLVSAGLAMVTIGLVPFVLFTGVLYKEHKAAFGP